MFTTWFCRLGVLTALLLAACGGDSGVSLVLNLRTDYTPNVDFAEVRVSLALPGSDEEEARVRRAELADYATGEQIATFEGLAAGQYRLRAQLLASNGRVVGERTISFMLTQSTSSTMVITRSCAGVVCPSAGDASATECSGGRCVRPDCTPENPAACGSGCAESVECTGAAQCATGVCTAEGSCLFVTAAGACGAGEYCDSTVGCLPYPTMDAGPRDGGTDAPVASDGGMDAGDDAGLPPSCDAPCDTGNVCEVGVFDCSSGVPVCTATGAGNAGATCRESGGACDMPESCDGTSTECPADGKQPAGTVCNAASGPCDVEEVCDGSANACPLDAFQPVGTSCPSGFCDESHVCSSTCTPGAACTPANICRTGTINCAAGVPSCVESGNVSNGTTCQATEFGAYGSCGGYSATCDETGTQDRSVSDYTCQSGSCTLASSSESRACTRDTDGGSCGSVTFGGWGSCGGFSGTCDSSGTESRSVMTPTCSAADCMTATTSESRSCSRTTNGLPCGTVTYGGWSACSGYASVCDSTGTQNRDVYTPTCGGDSCGMVTSNESRGCTRTTEGSSCGSETYGPFGSCGSFGGPCDESGFQNRTVTRPTCVSDTCTDVAGTDSQPCTRSTEGNYCEDEPSCRRGSCTGGSCSLFGSACSPSRVCCEPGICILPTQMCP